MEELPTSNHCTVSKWCMLGLLIIEGALPESWESPDWRFKGPIDNHRLQRV